MPIILTIRRRGAGGHSFELNWFPAHLLTCCWSVNIFSVPPTQRGGEKLRDLLAEALKRPNAYYLPGNAITSIRNLLTA